MIRNFISLLLASSGFLLLALCFLLSSCCKDQVGRRYYCGPPIGMSVKFLGVEAGLVFDPAEHRAPPSELPDEFFGLPVHKN